MTVLMPLALNCWHCNYALEHTKGDGSEVCRFCYPHFTKAKMGRACPACLEGRWHTL